MIDIPESITPETLGGMLLRIVNEYPGLTVTIQKKQRDDQEVSVAVLNWESLEPGDLFVGPISVSVAEPVATT